MCSTSKENRFKDRYRTGDTPWDIGRPDFNLIHKVTKQPIISCKALEIGCGTGDNAVWLAQQNFTVTGSDVSEIAIQKARQKALQADIACTFVVLDFLNQKIPGAPFGFAFDRGCLHTFDTDELRSRFAENVAFHLAKSGLWLSLVGSADDPPRDTGPPQRTARDIVVAVEPYFEILSLDAGHFDSNRSRPPRAWVCLMRKRERTQV